MKKNLLFAIALLISLSLSAGKSNTKSKYDKEKAEIGEALKVWNNATKSANKEAVMALFDNTDDILVIGSDSGEIFRGKEQVGKWLDMLFKHNSFSWEMNTIDIDFHEKTAWVFIDGTMVVANDKGKIRKTPYRFSGILVKKKGEWKWRMFDGAIPRGE